MRKILFLTICFFALASLALGQDFEYRPVGFEQVTVDSTSGGIKLTPGMYKAGPSYKAEAALISVETAEIRWISTGAPPTTTFGHPAQVNQMFMIESTDELEKFRAIRTGSTSGKINVTYYKRYRISTQ